MMLTALIIEPAQKINVQTLALSTVHVVRVLFVRLHLIGLSAAVQVDGQGTLTQNVTHVGYIIVSKEQEGSEPIFLLLDECQVNNDCPLDKACKSQECVNPCLTTQCGSRAQCEVDYHTAICVCPPGLQGNPLVACIEAGCSTNNECATDQVCDFAPGSGFTRKECRPLCSPGNCANGADCTAKDHRETCTCRYPLIGDGYAACLEGKTILVLVQENQPLCNACLPNFSC